MTQFLFGLFTGGVVGVFIACFLAASKIGDLTRSRAFYRDEWLKSRARETLMRMGENKDDGC